MSQSNGAVKRRSGKLGVESRLDSTQVVQRGGPRVEFEADSTRGAESGGELQELYRRVEVALAELLAVKEALAELLGQGEECKVKNENCKSEIEEGQIERPTLNVERSMLTEGMREAGEEEEEEEDVDGGAVTPVECERRVGEVVGDEDLARPAAATKAESGKPKAEEVCCEDRLSRHCIAEECERSRLNGEHPTLNVEQRTLNLKPETLNSEQKSAAAKGKGKKPKQAWVLTEEVRKQICHYLQAGLSRRQAAAFIGCHNSAITKAARRDPRFAEELEQAERISEALPMLRIVKASRKSWRAAAWLVKHHQPHGWLRRERQEESDQETAESVKRIDRALHAPDPPSEPQAEQPRQKSFDELAWEEVIRQRKLKSDFMMMKLGLGGGEG